MVTHGKQLLVRLILQIILLLAAVAAVVHITAAEVVAQEVCFHPQPI
jgi:hypothetical protein